jgi:hypothetical protein
MRIILVKEFILFLKNKRVFEGAIMFAIGSMMRTLMSEINKGILDPLSRGKFSKLKNQNYDKYFYYVLQIIFGSYLFFMIYRGLSFLYDGILLEQK